MRRFQTLPAAFTARRKSKIYNPKIENRYTSTIDENCIQQPSLIRPHTGQPGPTAGSSPGHHAPSELEHFDSWRAGYSPSNFPNSMSCDTILAIILLKPRL